MSDEDGDGDDDEEEYERVTFAEVLPAAADDDGVAAFFADRWCRDDVHSWSVIRPNDDDDARARRPDDDVLRRLRAGFCYGDAHAIIATCRKPSNAKFTEDEIEEMVGDVRSRGATLDLPFCFADGARELRRSLARMAFRADARRGARSSDNVAALECANDVEVGVYLSSARGAEAGWHYDANHNVTIQLYGSKEWHTVPSGNVNVESARGASDAPRNVFELRDAPPDVASASVTRVSPGAVIYVPPGCWHRVVPTEDDDGVCLSVDVRVGSVTELRWLMENLHTAMYTAREKARYTAREKATNATLMKNAVSDALLRKAMRFFSLLEASADKDFFFPIPRALPFEHDLSDGLDLCASLQFLHESLPPDIHEFLPASMVEAEGNLLYNSMVILSKTRAPDQNGVYLCMRSTSKLTNMDYMRFKILCPALLEPGIDLLIGEMCYHEGEDTEKRNAHRESVHAEHCEKDPTYRKAWGDLEDVLVWARVLKLNIPKEDMAVAEPSQSKGSVAPKRQRR